MVCKPGDRSRERALKRCGQRVSSLPERRNLSLWTTHQAVVHRAAGDLRTGYPNPTEHTTAT